MELDHALKERRSVRRFRRDRIARTTLREILDLARHAPSSMDGQPWHFLVVTRPGLKARLTAIKNRYTPRAKRAYPADFVREAPVVIVVCVDRRRSYGRGIENAVLASELILLAAHARGLGAVYLSAQRRGEPRLAREIAALLGLPPGIAPVTLIPLGRPAERPRPKRLRDLEAMVHDETFGLDAARSR
jgi:nitroreductase